MTSKGSKTAALHVGGVDIAYDGQAVVHDASLDIEAGETYGLIGLNGAGKTTLIKTILGLKNKKKGEISIFGEDHQRKESRRNLAYLPERFEPPWFLSGLEFVKFSLQLYKQDFKKEAVYEAAERLALDTNALPRRVRTYSKGMRQKLGLIATFMTNCNLLILDEPMSGLDPRARSLVKSMLLDHKSNSERTVFLSSHILADLDEICERVAVIDGGRIEFIGAPADMKSQTNHSSLEQSFLHLIEKKAAA